MWLGKISLRRWRELRDWGCEGLVLTRRTKKAQCSAYFLSLVDEKSPCRGGHMRDILRWKKELWLA